MNNQNKDHMKRLTEEQIQEIRTRARKQILKFIQGEMEGRHMGLRDLQNAHKEQDEKRRKLQEQKNKKEYMEAVDYLLDKHNDYMDLYNTFGDEEYKKKAEQAMDRLNEGDFQSLKDVKEG